MEEITANFFAAKSKDFPLAKPVCTCFFRSTGCREIDVKECMFFTHEHNVN